jgi:hypothetical protein
MPSHPANPSKARNPTLRVVHVHFLGTTDHLQTSFSMHNY